LYTKNYFIVRIQIESNRDTWYAANQVDSFRSGEKESDSVTGNVGSSLKQEWWSLHQERLSSSSAQLWTAHASSGVSPLATLSRNCRRFNLNVFALLPTHLLTEVTGKLRGFGSSILCQPHQISKRETTRSLLMWGTPEFGRWADTYADRELTQAYQAALGRPGSADLSGLRVKRWPCRHKEPCPTGTFLLTWQASPMLFYSVVRRMPRCSEKDGARLALFPGIAALPHCLNFAASLLRHNQSGFTTQKAFQTKLCTLIKAYCRLSNGLLFAHVEVFISDENSA
jgi:hypothetical protein